MGAYLSHPKTDKASSDEFNDLLAVGASSMQGWRNSQEDAHNAILNYDKSTSFFAVYDGHGGAEVAQYCADKLPEFLKQLETYKNGALEQALKDAFLGFDKKLLDPSVVTILKILAGEHNFADGEDAEGYDEDDEEDLAELHEESHLPLNQVLEKYEGLPQTHDMAKIKAEAAANSKPQSPFLRGRRAAAVAAEAANKAVMDPTAKPEGSSTSAAAAAAAAAFSEVDGSGPSSSKLPKLEPEDESTVSSSSSSSATKSSTSTSSSDVTESDTSKAGATNGAAAVVTGKTTTPTEQNGSVTSSEAKAVVKAGKDNATVSDEATVSGSSDVETKQNGMVGSSTSAAPKIGPADITSTSKESKTKAAEDDSSTDDDADYDENAVGDSHKVVAGYYSGDDMEEDDDEDDDAYEDDEDDEVSENEEADEDQLANDQFCANMIEEPGKDSGCTAVVSLLHGRDLYVANAGDSRCVISRNGKAIEMSLDHKPEDDEESARIVKAGGRVTLDGRVNGGLNLSRALGDHAYKMNHDLPAEAQMISALPDIKKLIITPQDEFMVLACDGIWNYMSSDEVVQFVRLRLKDETKKLSQICEELFDNCLAPNTMGDGTGCDNMTAVIVKFKEKLQDLPATINPAETEDVLASARQQKEQAAATSITIEQNAHKRSASPDTAADAAENAETISKSKRLKTDDDAKSEKVATDVISSTPSAAAEQKECDSVNSNTSNEAAVAVSST
ncbi:probable protein phosphatase CG10417 [Scaptodrosophila lebanonensis]|uniref:protein-serine/threonine phosphatase n=1 Tax=Drosophila lebanonensis TaxID=7225 RepID=A0A6J2T5E1_DROLE|nr:probable protein phosphatase CG10417 [Scaptodrosophila lebanonensis]XP_030371256.1 probable protein phosphatase CG10417 [Scaptodrosophila lebanonensis]